MKNNKRKVAIILIIALFIILLALTIKVVIDKTNAYGYGDSNGEVHIVREAVNRIKVTAPEGYLLTYQIVDINDDTKTSLTSKLESYDSKNAIINNNINEMNSYYDEIDGFLAEIVASGMESSIIELVNTGICKRSTEFIDKKVDACYFQLNAIKSAMQTTYNELSNLADSSPTAENQTNVVNYGKILTLIYSAADSSTLLKQYYDSHYVPNQNELKTLKDEISNLISPPTTGDWQTITDNYVKPDFSTSKSSKILWVKSEYNGKTYYDFNIIPAKITGAGPIYLDSQGGDNKGIDNIHYLSMNDFMDIYLDNEHKNKMTPSSNNITIPTKENSVFDGYYTEAEGKGILIINKDGYIIDNLNTIKSNLKNILYAKWIPTNENKDDNKTDDEDKKDDNTSNDSQGNNKVPTTENKNEITSSGNNSIIVVDDELKEIIKDYTSSEVSNEEKDRIKDNLFSDSEDIYVFDTNIKDKDGKDIDLNGKEVTVKTPLPDGMLPTDNIKVYEIIDGEKNDISFDIVDNKIVFKISKMGKYAIVKYPKNVDINNPQTGDINLSLLIGGIIISGALLIITIVYIIKNKKNKI